MKLGIISVAKSASSNFVIARQKKIWGSKVKSRLGGLKVGDLILFVSSLNYPPDHRNLPWPRVSESLFYDLVEMADEICLVKVKRIYEGHERIWPDPKEIYPYRFEFEELGELSNIKLQNHLNRNQFAKIRSSIVANSKLNYITYDNDEFLKTLGLNSDTVNHKDDEIENGNDIYTIEDALKEVFLTEEELDDIVSRIQIKKNIILKGPPGVGKTYIARRISNILLETIDENRIKFIQFHQSYSYEEFIQGLRPSKSGQLLLNPGIFYKFCKDAEKDLENKYVFIIDEINRGNLSRIFGELLMLIENDKRGDEFAIPLTYSPDEMFSVPDNIYLIGTMNSADRSLAMVDYALRRRFSFIDLNPAFNKQSFKDLLLSYEINEELINRIVTKMSFINAKIKDDRNLGKDFLIGHSFFCPTGKESSFYNDQWYRSIIKTEIGPLLFEYWFDNEDKADELLKSLFDY